MARTKRVVSSEPSKSTRPPLTPETRENQMISLAMDLVEQRLREGTASSQETTHFLKLGTQKAQLELEKLRKENELLRAKTEAIDSAKNMEDLYANAIKAMQSYGGRGDSDEY